MVHKLSIMNRTGHSVVTWDTEAEAAIAEAERVFQEHRAKGYSAFKQEAGEMVGPIQDFDREADEILLVPNIVGG